MNTNTNNRISGKSGILKISLIVLTFIVAFVLLVLHPQTSYGFSMGYHFDLIREVMVEMGFGEDAYRVALLANAYVDLFQATTTVGFSTIVAAGAMTDDAFAVKVHQLQDILHYDGLPGKSYIDAYYKRLISNTYEAFQEKIRTNDVRGALMIMGITFHIIQDFYAHSNWVELNVGSYVNIPDATYFDLFWRPGVLEEAIREYQNLNLKRYGCDIYGNVLAEDDLFTHASLPRENVFHIDSEGRNYVVPRRTSHDNLHKDYAGRPYFDWAYRTAYRAIRQWMFLMEVWVKEEFRTPAFWTALKNYNMPESGNYRRDLHTATNFDGGTLYWIFSMAGAWKKPGQWGTWDMLNFDLPHVRGIGIIEQAFAIPFLGADFFNNCSLIAKNLFEVKEGEPYKGKIERLSYISGGYSRDVVIRYTIEDGLYLGGFNPKAIPRDYPINYMGLSLVRKPQGWLKVQIPRVVDRNPDGTGSYNNEDPTTQSDYYAKFYINNRLYIEAEYVDTAHAETLWQVLKPLWNLDENVEIRVEIWESDYDRDNEQMHISITKPAHQFPLVYHPRRDGFAECPMGDKHYIDYYETPGVNWVTTMGVDEDWGARIYLGVGLLSDYNRLEVVVSTADTPGASTDDLVWLNVGAYTFLLNRPHHEEFRNGATDIFTFDPGREWKPEKFHLVRLSKDSDKNDDWFPASIKVVADKDYYFKAGRFERIFDSLSSSIYIKPLYRGMRFFGIEEVSCNFGEIIKTYEFPDETIKTISVVSEVYAQARGAPGTRDKTYLEFKDKDGNLFRTTLGRNVIESKFHLTNSLRKLLRHNPSEFTRKRDIDYFYYIRLPLPFKDKRIKDIDQITLNKPGGDNLYLQHLSVWINDKLFFEGSPSELSSRQTSWTYTVLKPPDKPRNISPGVVGRVDYGVALRPTLVASAYLDPDGYLHTASEWKIMDETGREIYRVVTSADTSHNVTTDLQPARLYQWQVRYADSFYRDMGGVLGLWSPWSDPTEFHTNRPPNTPVNLTPSNGATGISLRPTLSASLFSDPDVQTHTDSEWRVYQVITGPVTIVQDEVYKRTSDRGITEHTLQTALMANANYFWQVRYKDSLGEWSKWSSPTSFTTTPFTTPTPPPVTTPFIFMLSLNPTSGIVNQGMSTSISINTTLTSGTTQSVNLSVTGLPTGVTATFNPVSGNPTFTSTLSLATATTTPAGIYTITISGTGGGITRIANYILTINPRVQLAVTKPSGGEILNVSSEYEIKWRTTGTGITSVDIDYSIDGGKTWLSIIRGIPNTGAYNWKVPDTPSNKCLVKIVAYNNQKKVLVEDISDGVFTIYKVAEKITVTIASPKVGEILTVGDIKEIIWKTTGEGIAYIGIYYSTDAGKSMRTISSREVNDGSFTWVVPNTPSTSIIVRVLAYNEKGEVLALGDSGLFTIKEKIPLSLVVLTPNGGEFWFIGSSYNITWRAAGEEITTLDISYSIDGGKSWITIVTGQTNTGSYAWIVPNTPSSSSLIRIQARDRHGKLLIEDISDKYFSILRGQN